MKKKAFLTAIAITLIGSAVLPSATPAMGRAPSAATKAIAPGSFADLVDELLPAVVNISSTQKIENLQEFPDLPQFPPGSPFEDFFQEFMQRRDQAMPVLPQASLGSGFVIDAANGYIVTNNHVVKDADDVRVTFHNDETVHAEVIGRDEKTDLAVLKVETETPLTAVSFGDSDKLRVGDWVLAIGNPFGLGGTVTAGIISARQRNINAGPYDDFLQTDASINRGNSGGPMFDLSGKVIGVNTAIFSPSGGSVGIGFAIPSALSKPVIDQIIKYGRTRRGWLGVKIQSVTPEIAESLGLKEAKGALVASVTPGGPAEKAKLRQGDVILEFNDQPIDEMRELPRIVAGTTIDEKAVVTYWRDGKKQTANVTIGELEKAEENGVFDTLPGQSDTSGKGLEIEALGFDVAELTDSLRQEFDLPKSVSGLVITAIKPQSEALNQGLIEGDVIVEINQNPVVVPADLQKAVEDAVKAKRGSVLLLINRAGDMRFIALKLGE